MSQSIKGEVHTVIDSLADDASWEDAAYHLYLHAKLPRGRREGAIGPGIDTDTARKRLLGQ